MKRYSVEPISRASASNRGLNAIKGGLPWISTGTRNTAALDTERWVVCMTQRRLVASLIAPSIRLLTLTIPGPLPRKSGLSETIAIST